MPDSNILPQSDPQTRREFAAYLDKPEAARLLVISERTLDVWLRKRLIPFFKIGRTVRFSAADIDAFLKARCRIAGREVS